MTEPYNPLDDVATPAQPYTGPLWPTFWRDMGVVAVVMAVIVGLLYLAYLRSKPAPAADTKPAIAVAGNPATPPVKQLSAKNATKKEAAQIINKPATAINSPEIHPSAPVAEPLTPAQQDFENRLANFESKTP